MAIPDYQTCMLPLLKYYADGREKTFRETAEALADEFQLTDQDRRQMLPSGQQGVFANRVGWARTYLKKAGLIESPRRGVSKITQRGLDVLKEEPSRIDAAYLERFQDFRDFRALRHPDAETAEEIEMNGRTPEESLEDAYQRI